MMMSDDDRDIDIESDEDNDSDSNSRSGPKLYNTQGFTQAQKRAHHNALERKRRDHIKDSFTSLREAVPTLKGEKASRAQILRKTAECIQMLMCRIQSHKKDVEDMKRQNALLEAQIRLLEKTRDEFALNIGDLHLKNGEGSDSSDMDDQELGRQSKKMKTCLELQ